jgi:hypothetical protein
MQKDEKVADIETILITNYERCKFSPDHIKFLCNQVEILISKKDRLDM